MRVAPALDGVPPMFTPLKLRDLTSIKRAGVTNVYVLSNGWDAN